MKIAHWMKRENSGLATSTLELAEAEERLGHEVCMLEPSTEATFYGTNRDIDIHCIHSQLSQSAYQDGKPKLMWMHGEPLSSFGNGISLKAICDLAPRIDAFICMRREEWPVWQSIKTTYLVQKGIDLKMFRPLDGITEMLSGEPAVLYYENIRRERNPLYIMKAMEIVEKRFSKARLHIYNLRDKKAQETLQSLNKQTKWWTFLRSMLGPVDGGEAVNLLLNRCHIVASGLFPLYARSIEAFGAGKGLVCPGYRESEYPYRCELDPQSIADAIMKCWEEYGTFDFREWAERRHSADTMAAQAVKVYERYVQ